MQRVIVTVKRENDAQVRDLEVPAEVESARLARLIAEALRWDSGDAAGVQPDYHIEARPLGRTLQLDESLSSAGVWDGAWLVFHPTRRHESPPQVEDTTPSQIVSTPSPIYQETPQEPDFPTAVTRPTSPTVAGWRSLGVDLPSSNSQSANESVPKAEQPASSFVWKQLDD